MERLGNRNNRITHQEVSEPPVPADVTGVRAGPHSSLSSSRNNSSSDNVKEEDKILIPFEELNPCPICLRRNRRFMFIKPTELNKHIQEEHLTSNIVWTCRRCKKGFEKLHPLSCHIPKCKGERVQYEHRCTNCEASFPTMSGLSQHERHKHPVARNERRADAANRTPRSRYAPSSVWSEDEVRELIALNEVYAGMRNINVLIAQHMPNKTNKQISDKRKQLSINKPRQETEEPVENTVSPEERQESFDDSGSSTSSVEFVDAQEHQEISTEQEEDDRTWREKLKEAAMQKHQMPQAWTEWNKKSNEIASIWPADTEQIEKLYEVIEKQLNSPKDDEDGPRSRSKKPNGKNTTNNRRNHGRKNNQRKQPSRSEKRRFEYARCQELFNNEPKKLADIIASNDMTLLQQNNLPNKNLTVELYEKLWGTEGPKETPAFDKSSSPPKRIEDLLTPISAGEIEAKIKEINNKSAAGLDGITKGDIRGKGISIVLAKFFNILLMNMYYPKQWRKNRTTLIPKIGKEQSDIKNWRPITISSILSRIFSSLIDKRLRRTIKQSDRQKGFKYENGCFANVRILSSALKILKENGGVLGIEDVAKAFDTVPHVAIRPALERKGVHPKVAAYIASMYDNCHTLIKTNGGNVPITLKRGVKQGDPLSPLIFNLCIEPIIEELQATTEGIKIEGRNVAAMAFADDLVVIGKNRQTAEKQLQMLVKYLDTLGMELSIHKCTIMEFVSKNKSWFLKDPDISIKGTKVPSTQVDEALRYLGTKITPWKGLIDNFEYEAFQELMTRIKRIPLKPMQKLELLTTYLLPRYTYGLIMNPPAQNTLKKIDRLVREEVKRMLHISEKTSTAFMYIPKRLGGLGLTNIENMVKIAVLKNATKAGNSDDPITELAIQYEKIEPRLREYAKALRISWPTTIEELNLCKDKVKRDFIKQWSQQKVQGQGASEFCHSDSNAWLLHSSMLKHSRIADAIKLRTNTYPTRVCMKQFVAKGNPHFDTTCRRCRGPQETLGHILGECCVTKPKRIHRHNEIRDLIANKLATKHEVLLEHSFQSETETLKPDLVVKANEEEAYVIDVTVRFERRDYLQRAANEKQEKYSKILPQVMENLGVSQASVLPIVIGSRGAIPNITMRELKKLNISKSERVTISMIALRSSIEMANEFIDYGKT